MIQINPLKSYIDGGVRAAITTPPSASLVFDLPGKAIWVKGVKLKGTDHTYTFSHDNYITLTNTPDSNESEDIKIGVNTSALKSAIDTTYGVVSTTANGLAPKFTSGNKLAASAATTYYFLGWAGSTLKWYQAPFRNIRINSETTDRLGVNNTDPLIIGSGNGISVTWDSTNKKIVITNTKPDINHNTHYTTMLYIGENNDTKANKNVANPYLKLFDDNTRRATFQIKAGSGIAVASDANGNITITNSSPDVNHNTDRTGIKLTTVSGTKKTDSTLILANSTTGLNIQGGTNKFLIGNGTNYIEVPVVPSVSNKDATIGTTLTTIATIAGVDIKAKIASYSLSNHTHSIKINGSTKTIAASGAVDLGSYLPLSGGTMILGEGLKFHANENYFGTNLDARIISLLDGNGTTCDGGLIIDERCTSNGTEYVTELLRIRDAEFKWKGLNILHAGNSDVSGGGSSWGSSITVNINGTSKTLTIPGNPNTDYRVTQSETTTSNYRPLVVGYTNVSTAGSGMTGSVTNQVYLSNKFYVQPSTGNLYATTFVGLLLGNAATSSKWITARTLNLTGSVTGSASFDGSGNIILATTTNHTHSLYLPLAGGTMTGSICSDSGYVILNPIKASYHTTTSTVLGCITINLPANVGNTMISMWIDVYIYEYQKSFSVHCGGYTYNNSTWVNSPFATVYGANHRVRLGHNGTQFVVYIGETNTKWSYPQVSVRNVTLGFSPTLSNWAKAWSVSFSTSVSNVTYDTTTYAWTTKNLSKGEFATSSHTHSNYVTALGTNGNYLTWAKNGNTSNITIPYATSATNADKLDGYHASAFATSGHTHSLGNKSASDLSSTYPSGISIGGIYNNGYPFTYGCTITACGNGGYFQIAGQWNSDVSSISNYDFPTEMYIRGRRDSFDVWTTWSRVLTNRNYNNYAPTLTGTGASGTWNININGNANTVDNIHATGFLRWKGMLNIGSNAPFQAVVDIMKDTSKLNDGGLAFYSYAGEEYTVLIGSRNDAARHGNALKWGYANKYLWMIRMTGGSPKSSDWEKISAGYADLAGSIAWNNITSKPETATRWPNWLEITSKPTLLTYLWASANSIYMSSLRWNFGEYDLGDFTSGAYKLDYPSYYGTYLSLVNRDKNCAALLAFDNPTSNKASHIFYRIRGAGDNNITFSPWKKLLTEVNTYWGTISGTNVPLTINGITYTLTNNSHNHDRKYLRKDTNDSTPCQYTFTKTNDHAIKVGTVRGTAVGSQTGEYIHLYERVAIGSPSGWGSRPAPSYGLATYGGAWLATDTGNVTIGGTNQLSSPWGSFNLIVGNNTNKVVIGYLNSSTNGVVVGGHNNALSAWAPLNIAGTTLYFRINETIKATIDSNGNVGIGTTSPGYKLHVAGDIYTTTGFKKNGSSNSYVLLGGGGHKAESSLTVNYANTASGLDFNRTTITTGAIGWYKLAYYASTDPRGSVRIGLITTGGNFVPYYAELYVKNGWSVIDMVLYGRFDYISKFRFTSDSSNCYIEGYFPTANTVITLQKIKGASYVSDHTSGWNLYTTATAGSGTVQESEYTRSSLSSGIYTNRIIEGIGFVKTNSSNSYVLLGGGGHKAESSLSVNYANSAGNADTVDRQHFSYSNSSNSPTYLWATNSNGSSFLAARGSISVNYANSAGNADTVDGYHANGLFTALSNSNNGINITIGGTTKSISNISVNYANSATSLGQGALKHMCSLYTTGTYNAYKITTGWHKSSNKMPTINIRGYAYGSVRTIDCDIIMYHYDNTPCNYSLTNKGSYPIRVWQAIENDVQVFYINPGEYYGMFNVFVYGGMGTDAFSNWSMTTVNAVSGTEIGSKPIATSITGNASSSTIASTVTVNNSDANSTYRMVWHSGNTLYGTNNIYCNPSSDQIYSAGFRHVNYNSASYLLRSDGGAAAFNWSGQSGQPTWLWGGNSQHTYYVYNPSNFNVNSAAVLRGNASNPNNSHPGHGAKVFYSWNTGQAGNDTTGYSNGITIGSNPGDTAYGFQIVQNMWDDRTYTRRYNKGWQSWKTLAWTSDIPTVTNYYWANIKVSASSNAYTTPQFGNVTIFDGTNSYLYLKTATAGSYAYLASYNTGGQYGADVVLHSGSSMVLGAGESAAAMYSNNVDSLRGSENLYLTADGSIKIFTNCDSIANRKYVARFDTTGYTYFNSYINIGGHEKNASSPTYVWGSNSSDTYLRSYQTSSLSVSKAVNADYSRYVYCTSGKYLNFQWSGQSGLPTWLFGSNDGANVYVWNPSNFSVYKANKSDQLEAYTGSGFTGGNHFVRAIRYDSWHTRLYMGYYRDTTLLNTIHVGYADNATIATTASLLNNTSVSDPNTAASGLNVKWYSQISQSSGYAGTNYGFPVSNNANGILWLGTHSGPFGWQMGFSSNGRIYARYISNNSFSTAANGGSWGKIAWTSDIPTVTNYYWANVKVSSSSSTSTSPTFSTCYTSNWFRSTGLSGWYNETYGGGWYMNDVTWIRTHNNKGIYTSTGTIYNAGHAWLATSSGYNVGIGTTSPSYKLHVSGDSYTTGWSRAASGFYCQDTGVHFTHNGTKGQIAIISNNEFCWGANSNVLHFNYALPSLGTTVTLYVWNAGNSSSYASHTTGHITLGNSGYLIKRVGCSVSWVNGRNSAIVRQTSANGYSVVVSSKTTNGSWEIGNYTGNGDSLYFTYITDSNYNSGNNTFSGQVYFDTSGTFYASNLSASNWVYANNIEISDDAFIYGNVNTSGSTYAAHFYENSDIRYKKILRNLSINSNTIANLPLFDFEWIENNAIGTGTSALAVLLILPNLVSGTDKLTLDYGVLGTIAGITACKELVTQKSELLQLKEKVKLLEDKLRKYENI